MSGRYLFGPVTGQFAEDYLSGPRETGECLVFDHHAGVDLLLEPADTWESFRARFPAGWQPDFIALFLPYRTIPGWLWSAPVPIIGLAGDWNLLWHWYRVQLRGSCDLILTDTVGVEQFKKEGFKQVRPWKLYGASRPLAEMAGQGQEGKLAACPTVGRDIDILFAGNFHGAVQRERMPWLARVARLSERWKVVLATDVRAEEYRKLLARSRIVFNRSVRGEWNQRAGEALAGGAVLFQEADNREVPMQLRDRRECVLYKADNLEALLNHYLEHEEQRRAIAAAGQARLKEFTFEHLWNKAIAKIERQLPELRERAQVRAAAHPDIDFETRSWQYLNTKECFDPSLPADLRQALESQPRSAGLHNCLGLVLSWPPRTKTIAESSAVAEAFQRAWTSDPRHVVAGLNLAEILAEMGRKAEAQEQAVRTLAMLDTAGGDACSTMNGASKAACSTMSAAHYPAPFDDFRVAWERAAWENAGEPKREAEAKRTLLHWRLHLLLGHLTGDLVHLAEAAEARPDLPVSHAALGQALLLQRRWPEAARRLRRALDQDAFDAGVARNLYQVLGHMGDRAGQEALGKEYRLINRAAPGIVAAEAWFQTGALPSQPVKVARTLCAEDFQARYGIFNDYRALDCFTPRRDAEVVLTLLTHFQPKRIVEIGTAAGHMTANLSEWSPADAKIFSLGLTAGMAASTPAQQRSTDDPPQEAFGQHANHFGKGHKVTLIAADSLEFDFQQLAAIDFAFIDGAHDLRHVWSDSVKVYDVLSPGGVMVWHDFGSATAWVEVRQALEQLPFVEAIEHVEGSEVAFLRKRKESTDFADCADVRKNNCYASAADSEERHPLRIIWEGGFAALHSLALVNREICMRLVERGHDVSLVPTQTVGSDSHVLPVPWELADRFRKVLDGEAEVQVAHQWPPNFQRPSAGRWVIMQPWEFGSLPKPWIEPLARQVDEVWVHCRWVRDCFLRSGIPPARVHVIPLAADPAKCRAPEQPFALATRKSFKFLFVGGTIQRKGIDLLLKAYQSSFCSQDDVCLVVKDMGVGTFYRNQTADSLLAAFRQQPAAPEIEYIDRELTAEEMAGLYAACDCLVHPFRGEGFGLPIVEAMAHGLSCIITGYGPVLDYCSGEMAYLLPAREVRYAAKKIGQDETVDYPWLVEPDIDALRYYLRHVVEHPEEAKKKGQVARQHVLEHFTWEHTVLAVEARLQALRQRPIRRGQPASAPEESVAPHVVLTANVASPERSYQVSAVQVNGQARVSLCMIVKNEEAHLAACLESVRDLVHEIIIVDTGSTDGTKDIARRFGAQVVDFVWQDSFAAARNESLRHATGDWIIWLDGDERLDDSNRGKLKALFDRLGRENAGFLMRQYSKLEGPAYAATAVDQVRLFPNHPAIRWEYRVHEQILPLLRAHGGTVLATDIVIDHVGYVEPALQGPKVDRNWRLLQMELHEHPDDPFVLFNLGAVASTWGRHAEVLHYISRALQHAAPHETILPKAYALLVRAHHELGEKELAWAACQQGRQLVPGSGELLYWEAILRDARQDLAGAERCLIQLLQLPRGPSVMGFDAGLQGYRSRNFLAEIYAQQGRTVEAETQWRMAVAECPTLTPAWRKLGDRWLAEGRWSELEQAVRAMHQDPAAAVDATVLWGRLLLAQKDFANARKLLERVAEMNPQHARSREVLSHVLLQEGTDWPAAENVLLSVLTLEPHNSEAGNNLRALRQQQAAKSNGHVEELPLPHLVVPAEPRNGRARVCLSMIVKNEEANLPACLESVRDLVHEMVIADTGSTDRTKEVAARFGATVVEFPWVDSFAAARNASLRHVTADWVFWLDADDRLDAVNRERLGKLFASLPVNGLAGYAMKCMCLPSPENKITTLVDHMRLFRNHPALRWRYRVHEQILPALKELGATTHWTDVIIHHVGYQNNALRRKKLDRDLRLLFLEQAEHPDDAFTLFNLGSAYWEMQRVNDALPFFRRSLERCAPTDSIVCKLYVQIAQCHNHLGQMSEALSASREGQGHFPGDVELLFQEATTLRHTGDLDGAIRAWEQVLEGRAGPHFASVNAGLAGYITRHNLALAYLDKKQPELAEAQWRKALEEQPDYVPGLIGLAELAIKQQRSDMLQEVLDRLQADPQTATEVPVFRARMHLGRKDFAAARSILEPAIAENPQAVEPRLILSHVLLQEGRFQAAEMALRDILRLEPNHPGARQNLAVLSRQLGKTA